MSEYQYYEFVAIDKPLSKAQQAELRSISSRAQITATSFVNEYSYGDFKGNTNKLVAAYFDLHLHMANWGSRRLMLRLPTRLIDDDQIEHFLRESDYATLKRVGDNLVLDISVDEMEAGEWLEGNGLLAAMAPLRADLLTGDTRVLYLVWLMTVQGEVFRDDEPEPLPGIGPLTGALEAFAQFFGIDADLVAAAAERQGSQADDAAFQASARRAVETLTVAEKDRFLLRLADGDPHAGTELRALIRRDALDLCDVPPRTVAELLARAEAIRDERKQAAAAKTAKERQQAEAKQQAERAARIKALSQRGDGVWRDVEAEIEQRNAAGYTSAVTLLSDLRAVAEARGTTDEYRNRLAALRERHARKAAFISRLSSIPA